MALDSIQKQAVKSLSWLGAIFITLLLVLGIGVIFDGASWTPKLALDLEGGTQIVLTPRVAEGESVSGEQLDQAVAIIRQRVDASGVSETEITTQGGTNIVVSMPGRPDQATMERIQASAQLTFRPVFLVDYSATSSATDDPATDELVTDEEETTEEDSTATDENPTDATDVAWITEERVAEFTNFVCGAETAEDVSLADPTLPVLACDTTNTVKYLLGPIMLTGESITDAQAVQRTGSTGIATNAWAISLQFDSNGSAIFEQVTRTLISLPDPRNQFAIIIDGNVLLAPVSQAIIADGRAEISSDYNPYTQETAQALADQLKFGALPFSFTIETVNQISATLGSYQLTAGLIAGGIGLLLVVLYSLVQYRALGTVTIFSLAVAGAFTYLILTILSWRQGYRLSLAGVAGVIVAVGITADSFIVYFERIRDELRDGKSLGHSVENGWKRALRTILASDGVNLLAAIVLYLLAVGSVRGFAFTLGLTTIIDVLVVSMFTHPVLQLISRWRFFGGGHKMSGLDPEALGAVYRGRVQFREPVVRSAQGKGAKSAKSLKEAQKRQTIAERKASQEADR
ncbi:MAG: protein translocase subunit SecD [Microbacteriaceae bacterium]|nr:protein translocase subunit SecD [Microbacteriaceae bacterium]